MVGWLALEPLTEVAQAQREGGVRQRGELCGTWLEIRARVSVGVMVRVRVGVGVAVTVRVGVGVRVGVRARVRVGVRVGVRGEMCGTAAPIRLLL